MLKRFRALSSRLLHLHLGRNANDLLLPVQRQTVKGGRAQPTALLPSSLLHSTHLPRTHLPRGLTNPLDQKIIGRALIVAAVAGFANCLLQYPRSNLS